MEENVYDSLGRFVALHFPQVRLHIVEYSICRVEALQNFVLCSRSKLWPALPFGCRFNHQRYRFVLVNVNERRIYALVSKWNVGLS